MHPVFIIERKDTTGPLGLERVNQSLQHSDRPGYEAIGSQGLQARTLLLIVLCDEVVDADGRVTVRHVKSTAWTRTTNKQKSSRTLPVVLSLPSAATFNTVPHAVATPNHKIISYYNFYAVMNYTVNI